MAEQFLVVGLLTHINSFKISTDCGNTLRVICRMNDL